jgi:copper chaperone
MITFEIPAMSCGHCVRTITETVHAADPQAQVRADLAQHRVSVDSELPRETLAARLADAGYPPAYPPA